MNRGSTAAIGAADLEESPSEQLLSQVFADLVSAGGGVAAFMIRRPGVVASATRALLTLPTIGVDLPDAPDADAVARALTLYPASRTAMLGVAAVLRTPERPGTFAVGPARATLRRKVRAAIRLGITVRTVPVGERPHLLALANAHEQDNEREQYRIAAPQNDALLDHDLWMAAYDAEGRPLMLTVIPTAGEWAVLQYFRTLTSGQAASDSRYLMSDALAEELGSRGVRYLVDTARPHWLPNGLRHFQRMVGFRLVRLRTRSIGRR